MGLVLKKRKGIAKLALRTGHPIVPAYSIGNTAAFSAWFDPFGILERISQLPPEQQPQQSPGRGRGGDVMEPAEPPRKKKSSFCVVL